MYRLADGVEALAHILHPKLVDGPLPQGTALKLSLQAGHRCRHRNIVEHFKAYEWLLP